MSDHDWDRIEAAQQAGEKLSKADLKLLSDEYIREGRERMKQEPRTLKTHPYERGIKDRLVHTPPLQERKRSWRGEKGGEDQVPAG